jgi:hypothetical protein
MEPPNQDMPKMIKFLQDNGYEFRNIDYNPRVEDRARAIFEKTTHIMEVGGNDINDATIIVTVDFDTRFDYKNGVVDKDKGMIYDFDEDKAHDFIEKLMTGTYGRGKRKGRRRKTQKKQKKIIFFNKNIK